MRSRLVLEPHVPPSCQRYSAPQSPINVIIFRPFDRSRTASISARSASERRNRNTFRLSSGCSETPRRVPWVCCSPILGTRGMRSRRRAVLLFQERKKRRSTSTFVMMVEREKHKGKFDIPTRTAPTNGWSRTHRTATLAMLAPPWRSPILRSTARSRWKRVQSPHTLVIASRYYVSGARTKKNKGAISKRSG